MEVVLAEQRALAARDRNEKHWRKRYRNLRQDSPRKMVRETMVLEGLECDPSESIGFGEACMCDKVCTVAVERKDVESEPDRGPVEERSGVGPRRAGGNARPFP